MEKEYNSLKEKGTEEYIEILETMIKNMPIPLSAADDKGLFVMASKSYETSFNVEPKNMLGLPAASFLKSGEVGAHEMVRSDHKKHSYIKTIIRNNKLVNIECVPIMTGGKFRCSLSVVYEAAKTMKIVSDLESAKRMIRETSLQQAKYSFSDIIYVSKIMKEAINKAKRAAETDVTVLIRGESGVGKELFAHAIHKESERRDKRFLSVNCASLPESLLESVLFGYAGGSFTGAKKEGEVGIFEAANGGTIFLDEIGEISQSLQKKLLRVLQEKEFSRVGDTKTKAVNVRVIAATNSNLEEAIKRKEFRSDLYYRLNVFPVIIPPLRERKEDIRPLADRFIDKYSSEYRRNIVFTEKEYYEALDGYNWPGNVRELENIIAGSIINAEPDQQVLKKINMRKLEINKEPQNTEYTAEFEDKKTYKELFDEWECAMIKNVYEKEGRNKSKTAKRLGISVRSVYDKLKNAGIS